MWEHTRFPGPLPLPPWRRDASVPQLRRVAPPRAAGRVGRSSAIPGLESDWSAEPVLFAGFSIVASKQLRSRLGRSHCVIAPKAHLHRDWPTDTVLQNRVCPPRDLRGSAMACLEDLHSSDTHQNLRGFAETYVNPKSSEKPSGPELLGGQISMRKCRRTRDFQDSAYSGVAREGDSSL